MQSAALTGRWDIDIFGEPEEKGAAYKVW